MPRIIDVRAWDGNGRNTQNYNIRDDVLAGLSKPPGQKTLPTLLLYDERGLRLYDDITTEAQEYYLFGAEEQILKSHADEIVRIMHSVDGGRPSAGEVVLELGAGALRKTSHVLRALSRLDAAAPITYYALDLEKRELERTLEELATSSAGTEIKGKVDARGMLGTYDDGLKFLQEGGLQGRETSRSLASLEKYSVEKMGRDISPNSVTTDSSRSTGETEDTSPSTPDETQPPLRMLFLGSSLGNFARGEDAAFLANLPLRPGSGDTLLLGLDHDNDAAKIEVAYNDVKGYTRKFIMNGLKGAGRALGNEEMFKEENWDYVNRYDKEKRRHEAFYRSRGHQTVLDPSTKQNFEFLPDEMIHVEWSNKYSDEDAQKLFTTANLRPIHRWTDPNALYSLWLLERPPFLMPLLSSPSSQIIVRGHPLPPSPFGVPTVDEWKHMWAAWDFVTRRMIPDSMMFQKPIDLRHICLFYLGHIPTFLDIHLSRLFGERNTEPEAFKYIFERGIDPNVDDPTQCHSHSEVPQSDEDWPALSSILDFQTRVRNRVLRIYDDIASGKITLTRKIARVLFMTLEHEGFHIETLLYMLLQRAGTGTLPPSGFTTPPWESLAASWEALLAPTSSTVTLGPATVTLGHDDIEAEDKNPEKALQVEGHAFGWDNESPKREVQVGEFRIEWSPVTNGQFYEFWKGEGGNGEGKVQFPATWVQVGNEIQVRTLYGPVPVKIAWYWPIMTSYDNLSTYATVKGGRLPTEPELRLFFDKFSFGYDGGANVGFRNWHPIPATMGGAKEGGRGHNGGVWEWTSTVMKKYEGFVPSELYPGYSTDFFDDCHQVVIGGSYATIPRMADRRTLRNYYQHNYPYAWVGGRIAYDVPN